LPYIKRHRGTFQSLESFTKTRRRLIQSWILGAILLAPPALVQAQNYTITVSASPSADGTANGGGVFAAGTSRIVTASANVGYAFTGWAVGGSVVSTAASYTFTVTGNLNLTADFTNLTYQTLDDPLAYPISGGTVTVASGISGSNIVGHYIDNRELPEGFLYNGTTYTTLEVPNAYLNENYALGVSGTNIVGYYLGDDLFYHGYLYNGSAYTTLDDPNANDPDSFNGTYAYGVNGHNVVGYYTDGSGYNHGFLYNGSTYANLDDPNAAAVAGLSGGTYACGISGTNIVGYYVDESGTTQGFLYNGSTYTTLRDPNAFYGTVAGGISGTNIVGYYPAASYEPSFLYQGGIYSTLNTFYRSVTGIFSNTIVGSYTDANGSTHGFVAVLTPATNDTIAISASPSAGGSVGGGGVFAAGSSQTVTAVANSGYAFACWSENGNVVSTAVNYDFTLDANRTLIAVFTNLAGETSNWTARVSGTTENLNAIAWSGGQFVAVGDSGTILTSPDGVTWTGSQNGGADLVAVVWSGTKFVTAGSPGMEGGTVATSPDGVTWTGQFSGGNVYSQSDTVYYSEIAGVACNGPQFVAVGGLAFGYTDLVMWISPNSVQVVPVSSYSSYNGIVWSGTKYVAVGFQGPTDYPTIVTSTNGQTWTGQNPGTTNILNAVAWGDGQFVAVGNSGTILSSPDGIEWTIQNSGTNDRLYGIIWSGSQFVTLGNPLVSGRGDDILTSPDGVTWTCQTSGTSNTLNAITYGGNRYVAVGNTGLILTASQLPALGVNYTISVGASPSAGGSVGGGGTFSSGSSETVTATANHGYIFSNWTENGSVVSSSPSYTFTVSNNANLVANFGFNKVAYNASPTNGVTPLLVQFTSPAMDSGGNAIIQWNWTFGDGATSAVQNPSHLYAVAGTFQPALTATNNFGVTVLGSGPAITVASPTIQYTANPTNGVTPLTVQFVSPGVDSGGNTITHWSWTFGDGVTSTVQNPSHVYAVAGMFQPVLIATNNFGVTVLGSGPAITVVFPTIQYTASPTNGVTPLTVQFISPGVDSGSNNITHWNWTFGDGSTSTAQDPVHVYTNVGAFQPTLTATNNLGATVPGSGPAINAMQSFGLVVNGGFETGNFTGWTEGGNFAACFVSSSPTYVHSGQYGAQLGPGGTLGYLSQTLATTAGKSYLLSFWLNSQGGTPNEFLVSWNGTNLIDQTNLGITGWTNLQFTVSATGAGTALEFGFRNDPIYFGLDDISVTTISPVSLLLSSGGFSTNGGFQLSIYGQIGQPYTLQASTNLVDWLSILNFTCTNSPMSVMDPAAKNYNHRFYRVAQ
jgi:PKD repeat protein